MYEVAAHDHCARMIDGGVNNPAQGLLNVKHAWTRITPRPVGLARAKQIAAEQPFHAVVCVWKTAEKVHDNGKPARVPAGTWQPNAQTALEPKAPKDEPVRANNRIPEGQNR
jgi:hypothetical protein